MAGPYTGAWRASAVSVAQYTGAQKWGTGVNPVHAIPGAGPALRRSGTKLNIDPASPPGGQETDIIAEDYAWQQNWNDDPNQPPYNVTPPSEWAYGTQTGTSDRPSYGSEMADSDAPVNAGGEANPADPGHPVTVVRGMTQNDTGNPFPSWGMNDGGKTGASGPPAGRFIRAIRRGYLQAVRGLPNEDVAQGWLNKAHGIPGDSRPADDSQVFIQTSDVQRYKTRAGSQRQASQSTFAAPIESRVTGQKLKVYASPESARHWDMLPYEQQDFIRPFLSRQAGTGYREWLSPNEMYVSPAIQREPAPDPALGPIPPMDYASTGDYGYSQEDSGVYY